MNNYIDLKDLSVIDAKNLIKQSTLYHLKDLTTCGYHTTNVVFLVKRQNH